jgi:RND superfamily putative drug exporter
MFYRLGVTMARMRFIVLGVWLVVLVFALPLAPRAASALSPGGFSSPDMQSQQAADTLAQQLHTHLTSVLVLFSSTTISADSPRFADEASAAVAGLQGWSEVSGVVPFTLDPSQISRDRHTAYTVVFLRSDPDHAPLVLPALRARLRATPDLQETIGGGPVFYADIQSVSEADLRRAEAIAFPFAAIALLLVFRTVIAALLPAAVGGCSVVVSLALLYLIASHTPVSIFALNITTLFGLGLGVDYSLFMVSRFREELASGHVVTDAIGRTMSTAGRAVFFSGLAVSIGLLGLTLFPLNMLRSVGVGGMMTVVLAVLAAVTLLPALLAVAGERINALPVRLPGTRPSSPLTIAEPRGFWHQLAVAVMRQPVAVFVPVLAVLLVLGFPFLSVRLAAPDASILPSSVKSRAAYDMLTQRFDPSATSPIILAVRTPDSPLAPSSLSALDAYVRTIELDPRVQRVSSIVSLDPRLTLSQYELLYSNPAAIADPYIAQSVAALACPQLTSAQAARGGAPPACPHVTMVQVFSKYDLLDPRSEALVGAIRNTPPPAGFSVLVDGGTAGVIDYVNTLYGAFPLALAVVATITYLVLMLLFRSLVLPLKAILMNVLSILASYGALVFIFQEGHFNRLLNFTPLGFVEASTPILMFCALFGLSMDYEVFLLSRIREAYEHSSDNAASVALGLERSGRIITSAAAIVILVSLSFASADMVIVKALGVGMALAVLLDATLVRGLLVPSAMCLLGDVNWWWPWPFNRLLPGVVYRDTSVAHPPAMLSESHRPGSETLPVGGER